MNKELSTRIRLLELRLKRIDILTRALMTSKKTGTQIDFIRLEEAVSKALRITDKLNIRRKKP